MLPFVDEHAVEVDAPPDAVWAAARSWFDTTSAATPVRAYARVVGCEDAGGFHVAHESVPTELALAGRHRFSDYALTFRVDDLGGDRSRLRAESRAAFPGVAGAAYRALVIGTGGHAVGMRRLLAGIRRSAEGR